MESVNSRLRDELLNTKVFTCLEEAQVLAEDWQPSALGARDALARPRYSTHTNPGLSLGVDL